MLLAEDLVEFLERALKLIAALATGSARATRLGAALGPIAAGAALTVALCPAAFGAAAIGTAAVALCARALPTRALATRARLSLAAGAALAVALLARETITLLTGGSAARGTRAAADPFLPAGETGLTALRSGEA